MFKVRIRKHFNSYLNLKNEGSYFQKDEYFNYIVYTFNLNANLVHDGF